MQYGTEKPSDPLATGAAATALDTALPATEALSEAAALEGNSLEVKAAEVERGELGQARDELRLARDELRESKDGILKANERLDSAAAELRTAMVTIREVQQELQTLRGQGSQESGIARSVVESSSPLPLLAPAPPMQPPMPPMPPQPDLMKLAMEQEAWIQEQLAASDRELEAWLPCAKYLKCLKFAH